jgi:hypothetical protein
MMKNIIEKMTTKILSRRDNMLVENEIPIIYHRPVRDGMWWDRKQCKAGALLLTRRSEDATPSEGFVIARNEAIQNWRVCRRLSSGLLHCVRNDGRHSGFATLSLVPCSVSLVPCPLFHLPCPIHLTPYTIHLTSYTLLLTP